MDLTVVIPVASMPVVAFALDLLDQHRNQTTVGRRQSPDRRPTVPHRHRRVQ